MSCTPTISTMGGRCFPNMGGVRSIFLARRSSVSFSIDDDWCVASQQATFTKIAGRGSFQSVAQVDENTGQVYFRDELNFTPSKTTEDDNRALAQLAAAGPDDIIVIVERWNGVKLIMGIAAADKDLAAIIDAPVFFAGGQSVTGTEKADANGVSFVLSSVHPFPALTAAVDGLVNNSTD